MTRVDFIEFLRGFRQEQTSWHNETLEDFLEAMEAYTQDIQGFYDNQNLNIDANKPTWENFKAILQGASLYE